MVNAADLKLAQRALKRPCRQHAGHKSATCPECYNAAVVQRDAQWARERRAAHKAWQEAQARSAASRTT